MEKDSIILGTIKKIEKHYLLVSCKNNFAGFIHISNISDYFIYDLKKIFKIDSKHEFLIIKINEKIKKIELSWKEINPHFLKNPFKYNMKKTKNGFKNLKIGTLLKLNNEI